MESEIREIVTDGGGKAIVIPHRAWSDQRRVDTDRRVWSEAVWDPDALFDHKGRPVDR